MPRVSKSQWEFGELFPAEQVQKTLTVGELTSQIKRVLEKYIGEVRVTGEVSNFKLQGSGHIYFVLKDAMAQINCVLFRGELQVDRSILEDGRKVVVKGQVTVYEPRGVYQLRVTGIELQGLGSLQVAFEKLKAKLNAEGLFAKERKRALPPLLRRIGIVTSPTGAAIRDVFHVIERRNPSLEMIIAPCRVQGAGAAAEISAAIHLLNSYNCLQKASNPPLCLDAILVTRGGGSLEDLWPFNEEIVARAIYNSALPVVSAVGHEIDFTISDFVADVRAATPSAAAEILTEGMFSACQSLASRRDRLQQLTMQQLQRAAGDFRWLSERLQQLHPRRAVEERWQRLDDAGASLSRCARLGIRQGREAMQGLRDRLTRARPAVILRAQTISDLKRRMRELAARRLRDSRAGLDHASAGLRLLGPEQVLARGYSITTNDDGLILRDPAKVRGGDWIRTRLQKGELRSRAEKQRGN